MYHWHLIHPEYQAALSRAHQQRTEAMSRAAYLSVVGVEWTVRWLARAAATATRRAVAAHARWQSRRRTVRALSRLDERMLRDVGIDPGGIESVAAELARRGAAPVYPAATLRPVVTRLRLDLECPELRLAA